MLRRVATDHAGAADDQDIHAHTVFLPLFAVNIDGWRLACIVRSDEAARRSTALP